MIEQLKKINDEIYYFNGDVVKVDSTIVDFLKEEAFKNKSGKCRVCCHPNEQAKHHDMIIVHTKEAIVQPHRHKTKVESFHVIEGETNIILFDESGIVTDKIPLGQYGKGKPFYYRLNDSIYHSLEILTDCLVFHETTNGPFIKEDSIFPSWA